MHDIENTRNGSSIFTSSTTSMKIRIRIFLRKMKKRILKAFRRSAVYFDNNSKTTSSSKISSNYNDAQLKMMLSVLMKQYPQIYYEVIQKFDESDHTKMHIDNRISDINGDDEVRIVTRNNDTASSRITSVNMSTGRISTVDDNDDVDTPVVDIRGAVTRTIHTARRHAGSPNVPDVGTAVKRAFATVNSRFNRTNDNTSTSDSSSSENVGYSIDSSRISDVNMNGSRITSVNMNTGRISAADNDDGDDDVDAPSVDVSGTVSRVIDTARRHASSPNVSGVGTAVKRALGTVNSRFNRTNDRTSTSDSSSSENVGYSIDSSRISDVNINSSRITSVNMNTGRISAVDNDDGDDDVDAPSVDISGTVSRVIDTARRHAGSPNVSGVGTAVKRAFATVNSRFNRTNETSAASRSSSSRIDIRTDTDAKHVTDSSRISDVNMNGSMNTGRISTAAADDDDIDAVDISSHKEK